MLSEEFSVENELVKTHTCAGRTERRYSDLLQDKFDQYEKVLLNFFEVGGLGYIQVYKLRFGFLEEGKEEFDKLIAFENTSLEIVSEHISFKATFCSKNDVRYAVITWDNDEHSSYYPKFEVYLRKNDVLTI